MTPLEAHLEDEQLIARYFDQGDCTGADATGVAHLNACAVCAQRYVEVAAALNKVREAGCAEADAAFSAERLAAQRDHILQRLDHLGRPARVIVFPRRGTPRRAEPVLPRLATRWIAGAAVAGLLFGILAGQFLNLLHPQHRESGAMVRGPRVVTASEARSAANSYTADPQVTIEDPFLIEIETALGTQRTAELRAFDAFTPHVRDVAVTLR